MTVRVTLRIRARRNNGGSVLEWHPDDADHARELLAAPKQIVIEAYALVRRSHVSDEQVVVEIEAWPGSGAIESIDVDDDVATAPSTTVDNAREKMRRRAMEGIRA